MMSAVSLKWIGLSAVLLLSTAVVAQNRNVQSASSHTSDHATEIPLWQSLAGGHMEFEVASVRTSDPGSSSSGNVSMNTDDYLQQTGGLFKGNFPLVAYIAFAYKLSLGQDRLKALIDSLPKWATTQMFAIQARASSSSPTKDQFRLMMQSLLTDRFKLVSHVEQRSAPVFALTVVKPGTLGPNLRAHSSGPSCSVPTSESFSVPSSDSETPASGSDTFPFNCGKFNLLTRPNNLVVTGSRDVTMMAAMAGWFSELGPANLKRPIVDETGIKERFDFALIWGFVPPNSPQPEFEGMTFERAVKEQLGLYLKPTTGPVSFFVVDHVEMPSAN